MSNPFIGEIRCFGFNFAPLNWAFCNGQLMAISQNTALYTILGTTYGGDGQTTFGLPNLQGQVPMHWGSGPSIPTTVLGEVQGVSSVTLTTQQIPLHAHSVSG
ncbi:MAG TPA: tail fiber protein, partial [Stellaceae bacterium]|nr:tail fiber protein [Stellaceae bacterium]